MGGFRAGETEERRKEEAGPVVELFWRIALGPITSGAGSWGWTCVPHGRSESPRVVAVLVDGFGEGLL